MTGRCFNLRPKRKGIFSATVEGNGGGGGEGGGGKVCNWGACDRKRRSQLLIVVSFHKVTFPGKDYLFLDEKTAQVKCIILLKIHII